MSRKIELEVEQLKVIRSAIGKAIDNETVITYPEQLSYLNIKSNKLVSKPSKDKLESGEVIPIADPDKTFSQDNIKISYTNRLTKEMIYSLSLLNQLDLDGQESEN